MVAEPEILSFDAFYHTERVSRAGLKFKEIVVTRDEGRLLSSEAHVVAAAVGVMDRAGLAALHFCCPLVPHLVPRSATPHVHVQRGTWHGGRKTSLRCEDRALTTGTAAVAAAWQRREPQRMTVGSQSWLTCRHLHRLPQGEEYGEPGEHVGRVRLRADGQVHVTVKLRVKVAACKAPEQKVEPA